MNFREESCTDKFAVTVFSNESGSGLANSLPASGRRSKIRVCEASPFGLDSGVEDSDYNIRTIIGIRPKPVLVSQAQELRGASGVKLSVAIFENSKH